MAGKSTEREDALDAVQFFWFCTRLLKQCLGLAYQEQGDQALRTSPRRDTRISTLLHHVVGVDDMLCEADPRCSFTFQGLVGLR